ncbi:immunoglobulin G-binding protein A [Staphylococcus piscifermentans]|uniref:Immunoglobulin G-binding protein A n=1 Tax=Staphylococcus piscifermentans TaxID=70258 RepID=A0A239TKY6_9STAP|nr:YSIRK-type signal peptide-containing protein [Staphylococcus piscifermentans]RTX86234.1 YSIRK-type signal peptide-containing protein [Staphylococcus piscifermentans]GEP84852.1 immunoglobulin G-binding protein A [Staphylococcus piscifermentans]SNU98252.1 immunoglobulin G-binding protein A [Staphylococcus piscifermentans]
MKKKQLFSLRKLSVGIASVSLGTLVFVSGAHVANAEDAPAKPQAEQTQKAANDKDAQAVNAQVELAKKAGAEQEAKENAQNVQKQVELAKKVAAEQEAKATTEIAQKAYSTINNLPNLSDAKKDAYIAKVTEAVGNKRATDVEGIVKNAKAEDYQVGVAKKVAAEQEAKALNQKTQDAYNTINNLANLSDAKKDAYIAKVTEAAGNNKAANIPGIVKDAKAEDYQVGVAKNVAKEQEAKAAKAAQELNKKTQDAYNTINSLKNITDKQQLSFLHQVEVDSGTNNGERIAAIVADAKQLDAQFAYDKEQKALKEARELNTLTQTAYNTVNGLQNLTDQQKDDFNYQILVDSGNNKGQKINEIVAAAKALDAKNAEAKNVKEKDANTGLNKDLAEAVKAAHNEVEALKNLKPAQKQDFHSKLNDAAKKDAKAVAKVLSEAKALDAKQAPKKETVKKEDKALSEARQKATGTVGQLKHLTKTQKNVFTKKITTATAAELPAIVKEAKALDAKQAPKKQEAPNQGKTKDPKQGVVTGQNKGTDQAKGAKQDQAPKVTTGQAKDQNLAKAKVAKDQAKAQQKAKDAKKQLPNTGEQDQVLFGMLAGSLFASAGTLFLVQARRKENK